MPQPERDGELYLVRRWPERGPDQEWYGVDQIAAWDWTEAAEHWAQIQCNTGNGDVNIVGLLHELKIGVDLQIRHVETGSERRIRVHRILVPEYRAVISDHEFNTAQHD